MKAKLTLNGKEYEVEVSEEQVKEIEKPKYKRWRAELGGRYYFLNDHGKVISNSEDISYIDDFRYNTGNYGETKKALEEYKKKLLYQQQYKDFIGEDLVTEDDWKDNDILKYYAYYDYDSNIVDIDGGIYFKFQGTIYSKSKEKIENFIKEIGEENFKKYILEVKE
jgi:hypothetical protein|nr:MAG TPA: hypothetical protein [Caudoviricetes sp.]